MSALVAQEARSRNNSRGYGSSRGSLRSKGVRLGVEDRSAGRGKLPSGLKVDARGARRPSPAVAGDGQAGQETSQGRSRGRERNGRPTTRGTLRHNNSQRQLKPPPSQNHVHNKTWRNPSSLNSDIQSHAGRTPDPKTATWRIPPFKDLRTYQQQMTDLFQTLKQNRDRERKQAIKDGLLADPDKPTTLANAITPVGTCQDMCPEFERVERIVQLMVDGREKIFASPDSKERVPFEDIMVKRFRRSAAGYDEQLPSDIRPPEVLQKTLDYLFNQVVGGPEPLAIIHKFVWDRTRGIRNDFSIQQVTRIEDLKIAIDCFERIARFHILSLHQLSKTDGENADFDPHQEREQLNNTLLSLHYYYEDSRHKLTSPNEAEFRAYGIIFEIQDQRPDVEDRLQNLPKSLLQNPRIQIALKLHAAAGNTADEQGPLRPRTSFLTAQANPGGFWNLIQSNAVSYLMACVAEMYFNLVRKIALEAIWKAYKQRRGGSAVIEDWTMDELTVALGFDGEAQTREFCEEHEFTLGEKENGEHYIDLGSVIGGSLTDQNSRRRQIYSKSLVELKRLGRTLPAVINGMTAAQAQQQGFIEDMTDAETASTTNSESLFVDSDSDNDERQSRSRSAKPQKHLTNGFAPQFNPKAGPFNPSPSQSSTFGKPSFAIPSQHSRSPSPAPSAFTTQASAQTFPASSGLGSGTKSPFIGFQNPIQSKTDQEPSGSIQNEDLPSFKFNPPSTTPSFSHINKDHKPSPTANQSDTKSGVFGFSDDDEKNPFNFTQPPKPNISGTSETLIPSVPTPSVPSKSIFNLEGAPKPLPNFSFGTSELFNIPAKNQSPKSGNDIYPSASKDSSRTLAPFPTASITNVSLSHTASPPGPTTNIQKLNPTTSTLFPPPGPSNSTSPTTENKHEASTNVKSTPTFPSATIGNPLKLESQSAPADQPSFPFPSKPKADRLFQQKAFSDSSPFPVPPSSSHNAPQTSQQDVSSPKAPPHPAPIASDFPQQLFTSSSRDPPDSRSMVLDKLTDAVMLGDQGLLQQFIEFAVEPIIQSSIAQVEDEESWKQARSCRLSLLQKKYFRRWRAIAWNSGLMSKGRNRRKNLAMSMQHLARSTNRTPAEMRFSGQPGVSGSEEKVGKPRSEVTMMPPPSTQRQKRTSLPTELKNETVLATAVTGTKRKRFETSVEENQRTPKPTKINHRRSQTVGDAIMSAPPHGLSHSSYKSRLDASKVPQGSMLNDILMKQARRLAPTAKSDTTHTDYFRLKARGIDPDTPTIPSTKKRPRTESEVIGSSKSSRTSRSNSPSTLQPNSSTPRTPAKPPRSTEDNDDEALFAQIRSVREALADSQQWMQDERQSMERSATPQKPPPNISPPAAETPAQRRLRELKERGPQPSRTELRLRAMGDRALLPKGFWDGEGMGRSLINGQVKGKDVDCKAASSSEQQSGQQKPSGLMGFAALDQVNGVIGGHDEDGNGGGDLKTGASVDDAIEL